MIEFDEKFFEGEERDGFYVESEMKHAWAAEMEVLMEIDRICRKYDIQYFADSGTLLGAVRHNGYIPWDDDIDIAMRRSDYMKFINVAHKELEAPLYCADIYHWDEWNEPFARVVNGRGGVNLDARHLEKYHGCPYLVGVDIFILDNFPATEAEYEASLSLFEWILSIRKLYNDKKNAQLENVEGSTVKAEVKLEEDEELEEQLVKLEEYCNITIDRKKNIENQLLKAIDGLFAMYRDDESDEIANMSFVKKGNFHSAGRKKEWYKESILLPFENIMIPVPNQFYKALERTYGPKYLEPVKTWHYHKYPFYKKERETLREAQKDARNVKDKMDKLEKLLAGK